MATLAVWQIPPPSTIRAFAARSVWPQLISFEPSTNRSQGCITQPFRDFTEVRRVVVDRKHIDAEAWRRDGPAEGQERSATPRRWPPGAVSLCAAPIPCAARGHRLPNQECG